MNVDLMIAGIVVLFASIIAGRMLAERGLKELTQEDKARLVDRFAGMRKWNLVPVLLIVVLYLLLEKSSGSGNGLAIGFLTLMFAIVLGIQIVTHRMLRSMDLPAGYLRWYGRSRVVTLAGYIGFIVLLYISISER